MNKQILHQEHGQTLVLIALLLVGMLAFLGLVIDGGEALIARRRSQDASDAGAFAGARRLAMRANDSIATEQAIWSVITNYAQANGIASATDIFASFIDGSGNNICQINVNCFGVPASPLATGVRVTTMLRFNRTSFRLRSATRQFQSRRSPPRKLAHRAREPSLRQCPSSFRVRIRRRIRLHPVVNFITAIRRINSSVTRNSRVVFNGSVMNVPRP